MHFSQGLRKSSTSKTTANTSRRLFPPSRCGCSAAPSVTRGQPIRRGFHGLLDEVAGGFCHAGPESRNDSSIVEHVIVRHGVLEHLLSDQGANFLSALVQEVCKLVGTTKLITLGYHPQCDGLVEKFNGTLVNMLSKSVSKYGRDWDQHLPYLLFAYRVAVQESTGVPS